jgi:hypothetical protein
MPKPSRLVQGPYLQHPTRQNIPAGRERMTPGVTLRGRVSSSPIPLSLLLTWFLSTPKNPLHQMHRVIYSKMCYHRWMLMGLALRRTREESLLRWQQRTCIQRLRRTMAGKHRDHFPKDQQHQQRGPKTTNTKPTGLRVLLPYKNPVHKTVRTPVHLCPVAVC